MMAGTASTCRSIAAIIGIVVLAASIVVATAIFVHSRSNTETPTTSTRDLKTLLLDKNAIAAAMDGIDVKESYRGESMTVPEVGKSTSPMECEYVDVLGNAYAYADTDWAGVRGQAFTEVGGQSQSVYQLVVAMPSADGARQFLDKSIDHWRECGGKTYVSSGGDTTAKWFVQELRQNGDLINATAKAPDSEWFCEHTLSTNSVYVAEVRVCGPVRGKAQAITEKLLQNVTN